MTTYSLIDGDGVIRWQGEISPAPGGGLPSGSGPPTGAVTPDAIGALYIDTDGGALYIATGVTDTEWLQVGRDANGIGLTPGLARTTDSIALLGGVDADTPLQGNVTISDAYTQWNGATYGVIWSGTGTDGDQTFSIHLAGGATLFFANGNVAFPGNIAAAKGVSFPTTDPQVQDAWWNNNGTLVRSTGVP